MGILIINLSNSVCFECGKDASPMEKCHDTVLGWGGSSEGCHVEFTAVSTDYAGKAMEEATRFSRPDLPFVGFFERINYDTPAKDGDG